MTCIIGYTENGVTWMGGDSLASNGSNKFIIDMKKVFKMHDSKNLILGFSGSVRDLNLLQYAENLIDKRDEPNINHKYIVTKFIPNLSRLLSNNGRNENDKGINGQDSYFLLAYKEHLWKVHFDYSVYNSNKPYEALGSGTFYALGSLKTTEDTDLSPTKKIHKALQAASEFSPGVAPPFYIINTDNDEVVEFKE